MLDNIASVIGDLSDEDKAALLRAAQYLASLPGTEHDEDRLRQALRYARGGSRAGFDETGEPSQFPVSTLGRLG
jgi:hypothetical protein